MQTAFRPFLLELLHEAAETYPEHTAIEWRDKSISYAQLAAASNHVANCLRTVGIAKGDIVAVMIDDPVELITSLIGIRKAGAAFAVLAPNYPEKRLRLMIEETTPECFLVEAKYAAKLRSMVADSNPLLFLLGDGSLEEHSERGR